MKKLTRMSLCGLLAMGLLVSCGKDKRNYTETEFGLNMEMVYVEGGTFEMGATAEQGNDYDEYEKPVRTVTLDSYHIGKYEVTQAQWKAVMGTSLKEQRVLSTYEGSIEEGADYPMFFVSWDEAQEFCKRLSEATGKKYVLPTEAQWEYAARGGKKSNGYKYSGSDDIEEVAWYSGNSYDYGTHRVGTKKANELGIYDMSGNVEEWCSDRYGTYDESDTDNPQGPVNGSYRVRRGGSWFFSALYCRVASRVITHPDYSIFDLGFRVVCLP